MKYDELPDDPNFYDLLRLVILLVGLPLLGIMLVVIILHDVECEFVDSEACKEIDSMNKQSMVMEPHVEINNMNSNIYIPKNQAII